VLTVLGPGAADLVSSGNDFADAADRKRVLEASDKRQILREGPTRPSFWLERGVAVPDPGGAQRRQLAIRPTSMRRTIMRRKA
jgi:hypothetical protein